MRSIGFGGAGHDWSCCMADSGGSIVSVEEALLSRQKYGLGADLLRSRARDACLSAFGASPADVDVAVACELVPLPLLAPFRRKVKRIRHHLAHAYSAFLASPFERAAVLVADNGGSPVGGVEALRGAARDVETISWWSAQGSEVHAVGCVTGRHVLGVERTRDYYQVGETDNSLGHLYTTVSEELGFTFRLDGGGVSEDGKTMALAAFGDDRFVADLDDLMELAPEGQVRLRLADGELRARVRALLEPRESKDERWARRAAVAKAAQDLLERGLLHVARHVRTCTGERSLAVAGGVGLNCVANAKIAREAGFDDVFVLPAAGDAGTALGAALHGLVTVSGCPRPPDLYRRLPFLGPAHVAARREEALQIALGRGLVLRRSSDPLAVVAGELARGNVVGWYEGRSEFGPRALGHRSILADPRDVAMRDRINAAVKRRESFRPFAPAVIEARAAEIFDLPSAGCASLPFMLCVGYVRDAWRSRLGAVVHVDGTARVQVVSADRYPTLHGLLGLFERETGVPVLLNTSFNIAGEPIVESPLDAVDCFLRSDINVLFLDGLLLERRIGEGGDRTDHE